MQTAYIGMGANIPSPAGLPEATLAAAADRLSSIGRVVCRSSLYSTEPVGFADQPRFLNAVIALETGLSPSALIHALLDIEREFCRDRSSGVQNGPRTLDLDILLFGALVLHENVDGRLLIGTALVIGGVALVNSRYGARPLFQRSSANVEPAKPR